MIQINSLRFFFGGGANHCGSCCYNNGQYNGYNNGYNNGQYNNGQYNNGQYNNGYNNGQYNNGQYNNGNYNNGFSSGFTNGGLYARRNNIIIIITFSAIIVFIIDSVFEISANHIVPMKKLRNLFVASLSLWFFVQQQSHGRVRPSPKSQNSDQFLKQL